MKNNLIITLIFSLIFWSCKKDDVLPRATQEGDNTFGFLLNGEVWRPAGKVGPTSNFRSFYNGKVFDISAYRIKGDSETDDTYIYMYINLEPNEIGSFSLNDPENGTFSFTGLGCIYNQFDSIVNREGTLNITRFDSGIIAGTFEITLTKDDCKTINITEGRFDLKF